MLAAAAAMPAACAFSTVRRVRSMSCSGLADGLDMLEDHVGCDHSVEQRDPREPVGHRRAARPLDEDDDLASLEGGNLGVRQDRKSVVEGRSVSVRVDLGGRRFNIKKKQQIKEENTTY